MKLQNKTGLYLVLTSMVLFLISGTIVYFLLQEISRADVDEDLEELQEALIENLLELGGFDRYTPPPDSSVWIGPALPSAIRGEPSISDTLLPDPEDAEWLPYRCIAFYVTIGPETRQVIILQSLIEGEDLIEGITFAFVVLLLVLTLAYVLLNFLGMRSMWQPFHKIIDQIQRFDFRTREEFAVVPTNIDEFNQLNDELRKMTAKLSADYNRLKDFSENASHEMQTPLAIIQSKLELLFQTPDMGEEHLKALHATHEAANRLSRLHTMLNLLSRIENKEFTEQTAVDLRHLIEKQIENFDDIIKMKNLTLKTAMADEVIIHGNGYLLEILFSNLFSNAIRHNIKNGKIAVHLDKKSFVIDNDGDPPEFPPEKLFERFRKGRTTSESAGLGLAIAAQICELHGFNITYTLKNNHHVLAITF